MHKLKSTTATGAQRVGPVDPFTGVFEAGVELHIPTHNQLPTSLHMAYSKKILVGFGSHGHVHCTRANFVEFVGWPHTFIDRRLCYL
jgi:hypothetical protein